MSLMLFHSIWLSRCRFCFPICALCLFSVWFLFSDRSILGSISSFQFFVSVNRTEEDPMLKIYHSFQFNTASTFLCSCEKIYSRNVNCIMHYARRINRDDHSTGTSMCYFSNEWMEENNWREKLQRLLNKNWAKIDFFGDGDDDYVREFLSIQLFAMESIGSRLFGYAHRNYLFRVCGWASECLFRSDWLWRMRQKETRIDHLKFD